LFKKKSGIQKKKDVSFLAPDGEELRNKRQLDKYLKDHPGSLTASDFDWHSGGGSPGETPRRSARLSSKGRLSSDSIEGEADAELVTSKRAKRQVRENGKDSSPKTQAKNGGETKSLTNVPVEGVSDLRRKEMTFSVIDNKMGRDFCLCMFLKLSYLLHNSMMKI
jgi:hypothetical protein